MPLEFDTAPGPDHVRVRVHGALDLSGVSTLESAIDATAAPRVLLDLREVEFIDSSGLALLLDRSEAFRADGRELVIIPGPPVRAVLQLAHVEGELVLADE